MWTHTEMSGYMSIIAHYIDDEWNLHNKLIGFAHVEVLEHIREEITNMLYPLNLDRKIFSFTLDNLLVSGPRGLAPTSKNDACPSL